MSRRQLRLSAEAKFPERLRAARAAEPKFTQEAVARAVDVTLRTVQRWEDGSSEPRFSQVLALAVALNVEPTDLYPAAREAA